MKLISTNKAPQAVGPYSQAVSAGGFVFCSGQIALDSQGNLEEGGIESQTRRVLENLSVVLQAAGTNMKKVVKTNVYLKQINDFSAMNKVYEEFFGQHRPARATVEVSALPKGVLVEIDCIALNDGKEIKN